MLTKTVLSLKEGKSPHIAGSFEWIEVPHCCATCGVQFNNYGEIKAKYLDCGCAAQICGRCFEPTNKGPHV